MTSTIRFSTPAEAKTYAVGMKLVAAKLAAARKGKPTFEQRQAQFLAAGKAEVARKLAQARQPQVPATTKRPATQFSAGTVAVLKNGIKAAILPTLLAAKPKVSSLARPAPPARRTLHKFFRRGLF